MTLYMWKWIERSTLTGMRTTLLAGTTPCFCAHLKTVSTQSRLAGWFIWNGAFTGAMFVSSIHFCADWPTETASKFMTVSSSWPPLRLTSSDVPLPLTTRWGYFPATITMSQVSTVLIPNSPFWNKAAGMVVCAHALWSGFCNNYSIDLIIRYLGYGGTYMP